MADEQPVTSTEMAQAIAEAIMKQAAKLAEVPDSPAAAAGLKDLAEAYAWLKYPSKPH
ncbi:hypothetical protein [Streptomyces asoensis]|uniref:Transposase n=1 Tax=Streptomyces asoensis TaxID=249586 RepID=A0ABQ3RYX9_9ACTN|nr:hypothetical protein [Streptomyces asoensis]GGQ48662.1 hypothetical protein GCM10010496_08670 [Streptomyces asoensis]GHI61059.1 hypothetical protein Saso_27090 [Streptomyces asoensis]